LLLAFFAGLLTTLSPCVLPLLPLVVGSASSRHRLGPVALCVGLILSFSVVAVAVALAVRPVRVIRSGATGRDLVAVLRDTGRLELGYAMLLAIGLSL